jgi:hypothetical protein
MIVREDKLDTAGEPEYSAPPLCVMRRDIPGRHRPDCLIASNGKIPNIIFHEDRLRK